MAIDKETEAKILRYHFVEHWGVHTIASQLNIHYSTADRVLAQAGLPKVERATRPTIIDNYLPFIVETLEQHPKLTAARLYCMAQERGYTGGPSYFRQRVAELRPRKVPEAYLRLKTLPGEQAQVDWGHFGHIKIGKAKRPVMAFVMILSWSRKIFLRFYLNQRMESFLRGHVAAFEFFEGLPKVLLFDNLKSAVLERQGDAIRFHPTLLALSAHYHFEPRPVAVARGNEKGRVERAIRYIRDNFFAGRDWKTIEELNTQAQAWCIGQSSDRRCQENQEMTVREAFKCERPKLLPLPDTPFPTEDRVEVSVGKTPYIRFDLNDYSIPHTYVRRMLTVVATLSIVRILDGMDVIAEHPRCYGKAEQIENEEHISALINRKHQARYHRSQDRLSHAAPSSCEFLERAAQLGSSLTSLITPLVDMLDDYGASELEYAITESLQQGVPHPNAVRQVLECRREQRNEPSPIAVHINSMKAKNIVVKPASLASYDQLTEHDDRQETDDKTSKVTGNSCEHIN